MSKPKPIGLASLCKDGTLPRESVWVPNPVLLDDRDPHLDDLLEQPRAVIDLHQLITL